MISKSFFLACLVRVLVARQTFRYSTNTHDAIYGFAE
jgi:hypothetical protein